MHANIIQSWSDPSRIMAQSIRAGVFRSFFLQSEEEEQFWGFVSVFFYFFISKPEVPNFDALACKLGELCIQNSYIMFTYNIQGTSSLIFIGFCDVEF